jgi:two-component sensor histidine kinase
LRPGWRSIRSSVQIRSAAGTYGAALLFVALASLARWGMGLIDHESPPYSFYYLAVLFATVVGGSGTGVFAAIVGGVIGWWAFTPPHFAHLPMRYGQEVRFGIYLFIALLFVLGADHYRRLAKRRQDLAKRLQEVAKRLQDEESLRKLAVEELGHRLKNKHATTLSIIGYQLREAPQLRTEISNRLIALSRTDDLIMESQGQGVRIHDILSTEVGAYELSRASLHGPDFSLPPRLALTMSLIVHELATNAAKYGALSTVAGKVTIRWSLEDRILNLEWRESGGPLIASPTHRGFGLRLLSRALDEFAGAVETTFERTGLVFKMTATIPDGGPHIVPEESDGRSAVA